MGCESDYYGNMPSPSRYYLNLLDNGYSVWSALQRTLGMIGCWMQAQIGGNFS